MSIRTPMTKAVETSNEPAEASTDQFAINTEMYATELAPFYRRGFERCYPPIVEAMQDHDGDAGSGFPPGIKKLNSGVQESWGTIPGGVTAEAQEPTPTIKQPAISGVE